MTTHSRRANAISPALLHGLVMMVAKGNTQALKRLLTLLASNPLSKSNKHGDDT